MLRRSFEFRTKPDFYLDQKENATAYSLRICFISGCDETKSTGSDRAEFNVGV